MHCSPATMSLLTVQGRQVQEHKQLFKATDIAVGSSFRLEGFLLYTGRANTASVPQVHNCR